MTSFAVQLEPDPAPRMAAAALLAHLGAAVAPWLAHCAPPLALGLSLAAALSLPATLARLPGRHCRLQALRLGPGGCQVLPSGGTALPGTLGRASRAYADLVFLDLQTACGRCGWIVPRSTVPADDFRRLKALIRLAC